MHGMPDTVRATPPHSPFNAAGIALTASRVYVRDGDGDVLGAHAMTIGSVYEKRKRKFEARAYGLTLKEA
ncbi:uncharacterized protein TrAFT101_004099 [Trichoderma asperellum]|uniref:uncharacterized protein n=1 Tax=Trichoderma asperellum TaxID=101201 RepID=UPI00331EEDEE|nr:hypothetical protein TrAFT101_004099 [Trichoderma asperellum]